MKNKLEEAKKILQEEQEKKITACSDEVKKVLEKHGMKIDVQSVARIIPL